jgi:hypothetical protein
MQEQEILAIGFTEPQADSLFPNNFITSLSYMDITRLTDRLDWYLMDLIKKEFDNDIDVLAIPDNLPEIFRSDLRQVAKHVRWENTPSMCLVDCQKGDFTIIPIAEFTNYTPVVRNVLVLCSTQHNRSAQLVSRVFPDDRDIRFLLAGQEAEKQYRVDISTDTWVDQLDIRDKKFDLIIAEYCPIHGPNNPVWSPNTTRQVLDVLSSSGYLVVPCRDKQNIFWENTKAITKAQMSFQFERWCYFSKTKIEEFSQMT